MIRRKDATTLQQKIIEDHVEKGSVIFTDCWPSYNGLGKVNEYQHYNVNHSLNFVEKKNLQMTPEQEARELKTLCWNMKVVAMTPSMKRS